MARKKLGEILVQAGVLDEARLRAALGEQQRWGGPLGKILIEMRFVTEDALVQALSHQLNFPAVRLDGRQIPQKVLDLVPVDICEKNNILPLSVEGKFLDVAMSDPTNLSIVDELRIRTRLNVRTYLAGPQAIDQAIMQFYYGRGLPDDPTDEAGHLVDLQPNNYRSGAGRKMRVDLGSDADVDRAFAMTGSVADATGSSPPNTTRRGAPPVVPAVPQTPQRLSGSKMPAGRAARGQAVPAFAPPPPAQAMPAPAPVAAAGPQALRSPDELAQLHARIDQLEALVARDEGVIRKLMGLLIQKGICTREEILAQLK